MAGDALDPNGYGEGHDRPLIRYHYTSLAGLLGILTSRSIYQTDARYLNDQSEIRHALQMVENSIGENRQGLDAIASVARLKDRLSEDPVYVASFSKLKDSPAMWQGYVGSQPGVAIGIDLSQWELYETFGRRRILDVAYIDSLEEMSDIAGWDLDGFLPDPEGESYWDRDGPYGQLAGIKHPSFKAEEETRLVSVGSSREVPLFRVSNNLLVPYLELDFASPMVGREYCLDHAPEQLMPIREIVVGPIGDFNLIRESIESAMASLNYGPCEIVHSKVPLRF